MNKYLLIIYFFSFSLIAKAQTAGFNYQSSNGLFCTPSNIQFTQTSTGNPIGYLWNFGNGENSSNANPEITYNNPGSYRVKLIVIYPDTIIDISRTIVVIPSISTSIGYDRNYICKPGLINFTASSSGSTPTYTWDFGDGSGATTTTNTIAHNYTILGLYTVILKAKDVSGCTGTTQTIIKVQAPHISPTVSPKAKCVRANATFDADVGIPANSSIASYSWDFKDGTPLVTTLTRNTNHVYVAAGIYLPTVTVTTSEGCTATQVFDTIAFGTPPVNNNAYTVKTPICGSETASFISKATNANSYSWDFGDGKTAIATDTVTQHKYTSLGTKTISVTPAYNGCNGSPATVQIKVIGVIATYSYSNSCGDKKTFSFNNTSQGNLSSVSWDFGDGSPAENTRNVTHTYPFSGAFVTKLTVSDNITGCSDTYSQTIYTSNRTLVNTDTSICKNTNTTFSVVNTDNNPADTYTWYVAGMQAGPFTDSSLTLSATIFGNFNNFVVVNNGISYCEDTIPLNHSFVVRGPNLGFTALSSVCLNSVYTITNTSQPYRPADSVKLWYWNFGLKKANDSIYQPLPNIYNNPGTYNVKLTAIDITGCRDSLVDTITVNPLPFLYVIPAIDTLCSAKGNPLIALHSDSIFWSPANSLSCATCDTVVTSASVTTKYFITAKNKFGCIVTDSILVKVLSPPFVAVPLLSDINICLNDSAQLNVGPAGKRIVWSPATGLSNAYSYGPMASPAQTTTYTATLSDSSGCFISSADITVHVNPFPSLNVFPDIDTLCSLKGNMLIAVHSDSIYWSPSNSLSCATCDTVFTSASVTTKYFITATSKFGCSVTDSVLVKVLSPPFVAVPLLSDVNICLNDSAQLNVGPPGKRIVWSPATGLSNAYRYGPMASPAQTTTYTATLSDSAGCFISSADITVHVNPFPSLKVLPAIDTLCALRGDTLIAIHSDSIYWSPSNSLSCATCDTVITSAPVTTKYFITATSKFGCAVTDSILVKVLSPPFVAVPLLSDVNICLNDSVQLNVGPPGKRIVWSPATGLSNAYRYGPTASPAQTTTYTATLSDSAGCFISSADITVHVNPLPFLNVFPAIDTLCSLKGDTLIAVHSDSIYWSPSNSLSCVNCDTVVTNPSATTKYVITSKSKFGCTVIDSVLVKVLSSPFVAVPLLSDPNVCLNDAVQLNVGPAGKRIAWSPATGLSNPYSYGPTVSPAQTTTYTATLTDSAGCFTSSTDVTVHVNPLPLLNVFPAIDTLCSSKGDTLIAVHSDSIYWSPSNSLSCVSCDTVVTNPSATTKYFITAKSRFGCTVVDSILVKVLSSPFVAVPLLSDPSLCLNDAVQLNVGPAGKRIVWFPATGLSAANSYGPMASPAQTITYTATLTDSAGCFTSTANINVHVNRAPTVDAGPDKTYPFNTRFSINPSYSNNINSYSWSPANMLSCSTCAQPNGMATNANTFLIKVTSDSGCIAEDTITITAEYKEANILMPTAFTPNNDNLNDYFFPLAHGIKSITRFSIYNRFGKLVYEAKNFPPNDKAFGWNGKINGVDQPTSVFVYYVEALGDSGEKLHNKGSVILIR